MAVDKTHFAKGRYRCHVVDHALERTRKGNWPMIVFKVSPRALLHPDGHVEPVMGYDRTIYLTADPSNEEAVDRMLDALRHAGFSGSRLEELNLRDQAVEAECTHGLYQPAEGEPQLRENWRLCLPSRALNHGDNEIDVARDLNALFGRKLRDSAGQTKPRQEASPSAPAESVQAGLPDDEIPF